MDRGQHILANGKTSGEAFKKYILNVNVANHVESPWSNLIVVSGLVHLKSGLYAKIGYTS